MSLFLDTMLLSSDVTVLTSGKKGMFIVYPDPAVRSGLFLLITNNDSNPKLKYRIVRFI